MESTEKFSAYNVCCLVLNMGSAEERGVGGEVGKLQSDTSSIVNQMHTIHCIHLPSSTALTKTVNVHSSVYWWQSGVKQLQELHNTSGHPVHGAKLRGWRPVNT